MKALPSIAICLATFAAGIWVGLPKSRHQSTTEHLSSPPGSSASRPASADATIANIISEADPRLSRLLTAVKERGRLRQRHEFYEALRDASGNEIIELIARAEKLPPFYRRPLLAALIERWLELDPAAARAWITSRPSGPEILQAWARVDPSSALEDAFSGKSPRLWAPDLIQIAIEALAGPNLRDQVTRLSQFPPGDLRDSALARRIEAWAETKPDAAFQFANALPPGTLRERSREQVLIKWAAQDPAEAIAHVKPIIPELTAGIVGHRLLTTMADTIAQKDPKAAVEFAGDLPPEFRNNPVIAAGREWAKIDPIAALEWASGLGVDVTRGMRTGVGGWSGAVLKEAMLNHPEETVGWVEAFPPGVERDRLVERALHERLDNLPSSALFNDKNEPIMRLFAQLPLESQQHEAAPIAQSLAMRPDFTDLNTLLSQFEDETTRNRAMAGAFIGLNRTTDQNAQRVYEAFTSNLPPGLAPDTVTSAFLMAKKERNPDLALEQATTIRDPVILRSTMNSIMTDWMSSNPSNAQRWLNNSKTMPADFVAKWKAKATTR